MVDHDLRLMKTPREYHPLTRRAYGPAGRYRLYLGNDHLLHVHEEYFAERYRRFYFSDIQAIVCQRTGTREIITLLHLMVLIGVALLLAAMTVYAAPFPLVIFFWSLFGVLCLSAIVNHLRGPTCACFLQTAIGTERLYAVNRCRTAHRVLAQLQPLIEAAQGAFQPADLSTASDAVAAPPPPPPVPTVRQRKHCRGIAHWVLTGLLALDLAASLTDLYQPMAGLLETLYSLLMLFGMLGALTAALITQAHSDLPVGAKRLTWVSLGFIVFALLASSLIPMIWPNIHENELKYWGNVYSVLGETILCLGFWRSLRRRR